MLQKNCRYHNGKGPPPAGDGTDGSPLYLVATRLPTLVSVIGGGPNAAATAKDVTPATVPPPVRGVTLRGLGFRDAAATFFTPHPWGVPSGASGTL